MKSTIDVMSIARTVSANKNKSYTSVKFGASDNKIELTGSSTIRHEIASSLKQ